MDIYVCFINICLCILVINDKFKLVFVFGIMLYLINLLCIYDFVKSICSFIIRKGGGGGLFWFFYRGILVVNLLVLINVVFSECNYVVYVCDEYL